MKQKLPVETPVESQTLVKQKPKKINDSALNRKFTILEELKAEGKERDPRKCIRAMAWNPFTGKAIRYCERWAIAGSTICPKHGGSAPQVKAAAKRRLEALLDRKVERLDEISEQNLHMPSALGATQSIINRVLGKVGDGPKASNQPTHNISIGIAFKDGTSQTVEVTQQQLPESSVDAETIDDDSND